MALETRAIDPKIVTVIALITTILIFVYDISVPLGVAGAVPYITVILLTLYVPTTKITYLFVGLTSLLTLTGFYLSPPGGELWKVIENRVLALIAIWVTALVTIMHKKSELKVLAAYDSLEEKVRERTKELVDAKNQSEQANKAKSTFLSRMSHELRTPLNSILGFAQLIDRSDDCKKHSRDHVQQILNSGHHLLALITEVLEYSKTESGQTNVDIAKVEFGKLVAECVNTIYPLAEKRQIEVINNINLDQPIAVRADYTRLKQVLLNLLSNAVKYNIERGSITLSCKTAMNEPNRIHIGVIDTGPGISESEQKKLFQPFSRLSYADINAIDGVGIGLAFCKQLMELMDGSVWVKSTPGQGSEFWIDLPGVIADNVVETKTQADTPADQTQEVPSEIKILYIEDNNTNLELIKEILSTAHSNFTLHGAPSAEQGLELARSIQPDVILLDIRLPGMSGIAMMKIMKADDTLSHIPVIAISSEAMEETKEEALNAGVREYVTKPFAVDHFLNVLNAAINEKRN